MPESLPTPGDSGAQPPLPNFTPLEARALDCARCILAQGESDLIVTRANITFCLGATDRMVKRGLAKATEADLLAPRQASVGIPGQSTSAQEYVLGEVGQKLWSPQAQPDCRLRETGPPLKYTNRQQQALDCARCLIAQARDRNTQVEDPAQREPEAAATQDIITCTGLPEASVRLIMATLSAPGYFTALPTEGILRRDHCHALTGLGERRLGVTLNPDCPGPQKRARALLAASSISMWSVLRCLDCIADTLSSQPGGERYGLPGISTPMISSCSGVPSSYIRTQLKGLADARYLRRVDDPAGGVVQHYLPNPRIAELLIAAGSTLPPSPNCYSEQLIQSIRH